MRTKIYQINRDRDSNRVKFTSLEGLERFQGSAAVDASLYDEVFNADIDEVDLEAIYSRFNQDKHPLFRGHSLSVSDVVVNDNGAFFCDSVGFKSIEFDESQTQKPEGLMKIVYVEPHRAPFEAEIPNTLEAEQKAVMGYIEPIYNDDGTCLVGNEEAKLIGMDGNRHLDYGGVLAGPFFVCGTTEEEFCGLTDEQVDKYLEKYHEIEEISPEEVQADTGFVFYF